MYICVRASSAPPQLTTYIVYIYVYVTTATRVRSYLHLRTLDLRPTTPQHRSFFFFFFYKCVIIERKKKNLGIARVCAGLESLSSCRILQQGLYKSKPTHYHNFMQKNHSSTEVPPKKKNSCKLYIYTRCVSCEVDSSCAVDCILPELTDEKFVDVHA